MEMQAGGGYGTARWSPVLAERAHQTHRIVRKAVLVQARSWRPIGPSRRKTKA